MTLFMPALIAAAALLAVAHVAEAQTTLQLPPPASVSAEALGYMNTFPPVGDKLIDNSNRTRFPQTRWVLQHTRELVPTRNIRRGAAPASALPRAERDLGTMVFEDDKGQKISVDQQLETHEGKTPVLGDYRTRGLRDGPEGVSPKDRRDRAILATLLYPAS